MQKKKHNNRLLKKALFTQSYGTYTDEILVIVGDITKNELFAYLKKVNAHVNFSKWVLNDFPKWQERIKNQNSGLFCWNNEVSGCVLVLREAYDAWEYWETLMHEVHHIVDDFKNKKGLEKEPEAQAYLFEYLFHSLRRKLMALEPIK